MENKYLAFIYNLSFSLSLVGFTLTLTCVEKLLYSTCSVHMAPTKIAYLTYSTGKIKMILWRTKSQNKLNTVPCCQSHHPNVFTVMRLTQCYRSYGNVGVLQVFVH